MTTPITIPTERPGVELRQLTTEQDDEAYFAALDASRDHLNTFESDTVNKYPDLASVTEARVHPNDPDKLRLGVWDNETFVGTANLVPKGDEAEIGYWLDARHTGHGYATLAAKALAAYAQPNFKRVFAKVDDGNTKSEAVLERAGFTRTSHQAPNAGRPGKTVFDYR